MINGRFFQALIWKLNNMIRCFFCAPSGRGKTSLVKMLLGFVVPEAGEILVDGMSLSGETVNAIRRQISYVSQDADIPKGLVSEVFATV